MNQAYLDWLLSESPTLKLPEQCQSVLSGRETFVWMVLTFLLAFFLRSFCWADPFEDNSEFLVSEVSPELEDEYYDKFVELLWELDASIDRKAVEFKENGITTEKIKEYNETFADPSIMTKLDETIDYISRDRWLTMNSVLPFLGVYLAVRKRWVDLRWLCSVIRFHLMDKDMPNHTCGLLPILVIRAVPVPLLDEILEQVPQCVQGNSRLVDMIFLSCNRNTMILREEGIEGSVTRLGLFKKILERNLSALTEEGAEVSFSQRHHRRNNDSSTIFYQNALCHEMQLDVREFGAIRVDHSKFIERFQYMKVMIVQIARQFRAMKEAAGVFTDLDEHVLRMNVLPFLPNPAYGFKDKKHEQAFQRLTARIIYVSLKDDDRHTLVMCCKIFRDFMPSCVLDHRKSERDYCCIRECIESMEHNTSSASRPLS